MPHEDCTRLLACPVEVSDAKSELRSPSRPLEWVQHRIGIQYVDRWVKIIIPLWAHLRMYSPGPMHHVCVLGLN